MRPTRVRPPFLVPLLLVVPALVAPAQRLAVESDRGLVVSAHRLAAEAGAEMLRRGGNAVDAAVATGLALAVTYPRAGNLGGGGFLLLRHADGRAVVIDYRETAPAAATRDLYLGPDGKPLPEASTVGHRAAGVPGTVAGLAHALEHHGSGRITWAEAVEPARRLAAEGFAVTPGLARDLVANRALLERFPESRRIFLGDGRPYAPGETFVQPELAATLARLQREGPREFYEGETARLIADDMAAHGGLITRQDLRDYRPVERAPLRGTYRGHEILTMPPPSSGGIALLQMLAMLEPHDVAGLGVNSSAGVHLLAEVMRRAFRDRAEHLGDPDFAPVPVAGLLDPGYLARRMADFDPQRATPSAGLPAWRAAEPEDTTHFSIIDADGMVVANTYTINGLYGNGVTVPGAGFLLNNEMDDFAAQPGATNAYGLVQGEANAIAPGKRPLSSMTPTVVLRDGRPFLVLGSPGGPTIINTVLQVILNVVDHRMPLPLAVETPRIHHQWMPDVINHEPYGLSADTRAALAARGHRLALRRLYDTQEDEFAARYQGDAACLLIDPATGMRRGAADPRSPDAAAVAQ